METTISFAPLAGRLAAKVAEIRPVDGAEVSWANFAALFWCAIFEMLIALCESLDARAAADAASLLAAPVSRSAQPAGVPAACSARHAALGARRAPRVALVPAALASAPEPDDAPSETTGRPSPSGPWLAWSRDPGPSRAVLAPPWRPRRETRLFQRRLCTPISLRYRNEKAI